jgi:hypothetical protein
MKVESPQIAVFQNFLRKKKKKNEFFQKMSSKIKFSSKKVLRHLLVSFHITELGASN